MAVVLRYYKSMTTAIIFLVGYAVVQSACAVLTVAILLLNKGEA